MPDKDTLNANEFAVRDTGSFKLNNADTVVTLSPGGLLKITLSYQLQDLPNYLQTTEGPITLKNTCGVFAKLANNHFRNCADKTISLSAPMGSAQVLIESSNDDIKLVTDGEKGRQGTTASNLKTTKSKKRP